ncbi:uncharacterized protein PS065_007087 isoform 1-T2 [Dugong dugon]
MNQSSKFIRRQGTCEKRNLSRKSPGADTQTSTGSQERATPHRTSRESPWSASPRGSAQAHTAGSWRRARLVGPGGAQKAEEETVSSGLFPEPRRESFISRKSQSHVSGLPGNLSLKFRSLQDELECALTGISVIQGCDCGLHPGGVAATGACSEGPLQGCDVGKLLSPHLCGVSHD